MYEASTKLGGKIKSQELHGHVFNMGGEFIDSDDTLMIGLCERLGLRLTQCTDQQNHAFQEESGAISEDFFRQYAPVAQQIICDRKEMLAHPDGELTRSIKELSLAEYMDTLRKRPEFASVPLSVFDIALNAYAGEVGQTPERVTAEQFIAETMRFTDKFLVSDCGYRVEGGTEAIVAALHAYLEAHGVTFHFSERLESAVKSTDGAIGLTFTFGQTPHHVRTPNAMIALPAYALSQVHGLESFGMEAGVHQQLSDIQYASLIKFTVPLRAGEELPNVNLFSADVQSYPPMPGYLTFLCRNQGDLSPPALIRHHLERYAAAMGKTAERIFDASPGNIAFENPDKAPCFSTPSPQHKKQTDHLLQQLTSLADQGLGIAGTYFPLEGAVGFMECGLASVERAHERMRAADLQDSPAVLPINGHMAPALEGSVARLAYRRSQEDFHKKSTSLGM